MFNKLEEIKHWIERQKKSLYNGCPILPDIRLKFEDYLSNFLDCDLPPDINIATMEHALGVRLTPEIFEEYKQYALWRWNNATRYRAEKRQKELTRVGIADSGILSMR